MMELLMQKVHKLSPWFHQWAYKANGTKRICSTCLQEEVRTNILINGEYYVAYVETNHENG